MYFRSPNYVRLMLIMSLSREQWLAAAQTVFTSLDAQSNGLTMDRLMCVLREKLPAAEVEYAVEDALVDAGYKGISGLSSSRIVLCEVILKDIVTNTLLLQGRPRQI